MVDSHKQSDLIKWAEDGDSFIVVDPSRFAKEVLGYFFKTENFTSFVRQLNMYGFRKLRHLQQGVLKKTTDASAAEAEQWRFEHPSFRRGQPELLPLIERKKQTTGGATTTRTGSTALSAAQVLDLSQLLNGVNSVKEDLKQLKENNEALWQEAAASRERHASQQETINRILKFLASVFGNSQGLPGSPSPSPGPLMIGPGAEPSRFETVDSAAPTPDSTSWRVSPSSSSATTTQEPDPAAGQLERMFPANYPSPLPGNTLPAPSPLSTFSLPPNLFSLAQTTNSVFPLPQPDPPVPDAAAITVHDEQLSGLSDKVSALSSSMNSFVQGLGSAGFDPATFTAPPTQGAEPADEFDFDAFMKDLGETQLFGIGQASNTASSTFDLEHGVKRKAGEPLTTGEGSSKRKR